MRDGIYKNLPMPRVYRSLLRSCIREAERGETARQLAERALERDIRRELSVKFVRQLRIIETEGALPGFGRLAACVSPKELGGQNSPLEHLVLQQAQRLQDEGANPLDLGRRAVEEALIRWRVRQVRQIEQHCVVETGASIARPITRAAEAALLNADIQSIARRLIEGEPPRISRRRAAIDLDEDLTRPR
jgi:hypothetical protein